MATNTMTLTDAEARIIAKATDVLMAKAIGANALGDDAAKTELGGYVREMASLLNEEQSEFLNHRLFQRFDDVCGW